MAKKKDWIVYRKPNDEYDAVENKHDGTDNIQILWDRGDFPLVFCQFERKRDAINYAEQIT